MEAVTGGGRVGVLDVPAGDLVEPPALGEVGVAVGADMGLGVDGVPVELPEGAAVDPQVADDAFSEEPADSRRGDSVERQVDQPDAVGVGGERGAARDALLLVRYADEDIAGELAREGLDAGGRRGFVGPPARVGAADGDIGRGEDQGPLRLVLPARQIDRVALLRGVEGRLERGPVVGGVVAQGVVRCLGHVDPAAPAAGGPGGVRGVCGARAQGDRGDGSGGGPGEQCRAAAEPAVPAAGVRPVVLRHLPFSFWFRVGDARTGRARARAGGAPDRPASRA